MTQNALIIFIKIPVPGHVKTRLQPQITQEEAARIYHGFILDLHQRFGTHASFDCWYAVASENFNRDILNQILGTVKFFVQENGDIGKRMSHAFEEIFNSGYNHAVLVGSDIPHLPLSSVLDSFEQLEFNDVILGPSDDGGYYLVGLNKPIPALFSDLTWSNDQVFDHTLKKVEQHHLKSYLLKQLSDIDDYHSLKKVYLQLQGAEKSSPDFPNTTWHHLKKLFKSGTNRIKL